MLVHSLASKYARFVVIVRQMYWTPPSDHWTPPLLKSDDLFLGNQEILDPPLSKILDTPLLGYQMDLPLLQNNNIIASWDFPESLNLHSK